VFKLRCPTSLQLDTVTTQNRPAPPVGGGTEPRNTCPECGARILIAVSNCPVCNLADPLNSSVDHSRPTASEDEAHFYGTTSPGQVSRAFLGPDSNWNWLGLPLTAAAFYAAWTVIMLLALPPPVKLAVFASIPVIAIVVVFVVVPRWRKRRSSTQLK